MTEKSFFYAVGRRKTAIARVRLQAGTGTITINERPFDNYFPSVEERNAVLVPLTVANAKEKFDATIKVIGGGTSAQAGAISHGMARALVESDETLKKALRQHGLLTRDPREKERKKYGLKRARKAPQYTKR
ncbi:MAG: 30S ribosomal protein S9 [Chloroflexi bacterium]|nr:30S ribosomal protein S9 [Chloroflexota bacterium]